MSSSKRKRADENRKTKQELGLPADAPDNTRFVNVTNLDYDVMTHGAELAVDKKSQKTYLVTSGVLAAAGVVFLFLTQLAGSLWIGLLCIVVAGITFWRQRNMVPSAVKRNVKDLTLAGPKARRRTIYFADDRATVILPDGSPLVYPSTAFSSVKSDAKVYLLEIRKDGGSLVLDKGSFTYGDVGDFDELMKKWISD